MQLDNVFVVQDVSKLGVLAVVDARVQTLVDCTYGPGAVSGDEEVLMQAWAI